MADFTLAQIGEQSGGPAAPQPAAPRQAVQQPSAMAAAANFASGVGSTLFDSLNDRKEQEAQEQVNKAVTRFSEQQMRIAELVDRGAMSSQEGRMRMRQNLIRSNADNPNMVDLFSKAHETVVTTAGMGKVAAEGTEQEQAFLKVQEEALQLGFFQEGASEEVAREGTNRLIRLNRDRLKAEVAKEELAHLQAQLTYRRGQVGLASDQVGLETSRINLRRLKLETEVQEGVIGAAEGYFPVFTNRLQLLQQRAQDPSDPMTVDEANLLMRQELDRTVSEARARGATMSPSTLENILTPYQRVFDTQTGVLTGKISGDVANEVRESAINQTAMFQITNNPDTLAAVATSKNFGAAAGPILQATSANIADESLDIFSNFQQENGRFNMFSKSQEGTSTYLDFIGKATERVVSDAPTDDPKGSEDELVVQTNSLLRGVADYGTNEEFSRVKPVFDHIASDTYGAYITGKGRGAISKQYEAEVETWLSNYFLDEIQPLVEEEWRGATTRLTPGGRERGVRPGPEGETPTAPTSTLIKPFFTGDGVRFIRTGRADNVAGIDAELNRLNNKVAPAINLFLRAGTHLQESVEYEKFYNETFPDLFGNPGTGSASE